MIRNNRSTYVVRLVVAVAVTAAIAAFDPARLVVGAEEAPKPGYIGSTVCAGCHSSVAQEWNGSGHGKALSDPQLPETQRACEACHGPGSQHAQSAGKQPVRNPAKLKPGEVQELCGACHFDTAANAMANAPKLSADAWKRGGHAQHDKGCTACHAQHGKGEHALSSAPEQLCLSCHSGLTKAAPGGTVHAPVKGGQCLLCHDPHGSAEPHSVKPDLGKVCEKCHDPGSDKLKTAHSGYSVAGADCTRCHDPHSFAADKAYLRPVMHPPFAQRNCQICHSDPPSTALKKQGADTCYQCHPKEKVLTATDGPEKAIHAHAPVAGGLCTKCHEPHTSPAGSVLRDTPEVVCVSCHKSIGAAQVATYKHPPVATGACLTCHAGHGSAEKALLRKDQISLCQSCHADQAKHMHPVGAGTKNPNTGEPILCASCHAVHGSNFAYIMPQDETAVCRSCHRTEQ